MCTRQREQRVLMHGGQKECGSFGELQTAKDGRCIKFEVGGRDTQTHGFRMSGREVCRFLTFSLLFIKIIFK